MNQFNNTSVKGLLIAFVLMGFFFGLGFQLADQLVWFICDGIKNAYSIPLG